MTSRKKRVRKPDSTMETNLTRQKRDINTLIADAHQLHIALVLDLDIITDSKEKKKLETSCEIEFRTAYEIWYSETLEVIRQILPNRLDDFKKLYKIERRRTVDASNYTISDYFARLNVTRGLDTIVDPIAALPKFEQQISILISAERKFDSALFDIKQVVHADLLNSELDAAYELLKKGFIRGAGAVAGVALERHLRQICLNHNIKIAKKNPSINDYGDLLKKEGIVETPTWRFLQHLSDLRNLCDHDKNREPLQREVRDLIDGVSEITKTLQ